LKILMFGWEFPPFISGGLGNACYGLTKALSKKGAKIIFLLPAPVKTSPRFLKLVSSQQVLKGEKLDLQFPEPTEESYPAGYFSPLEYLLWRDEAQETGSRKAQIYGPDLFQEIEKLAQAGLKLVEQEKFDLIHCHDWLTFKAGIAIKQKTGLPFFVHIHSIEYDRNPNPDPKICEIESQGVGLADRVFCVSNYTKSRVIQYYQVPESKITVAYNGIELRRKAPPKRTYSSRKKFQQIIFLGRLTWQKGPEYFIEVARLMMERKRNLRFIFIGWGDMVYWLVERCAQLGLSNHILFAGFLEESQVRKLVRRADLFLLTSVSEPFGLAVLEVLAQGVPAVICRQSGVSEVLDYVPKANYWESELFCEYGFELLNSPQLAKKQVERSWEQIKSLNWEQAGEICWQEYQKLAGKE